jgi:hypothetical protein
MRRHRIAPLLGCAVALLATAGCGQVGVAAAGFTCGEMRADGGRYRDQARRMVQHELLQNRALSVEQSVLDTELQIRRACHGASDGYAPYDQAHRAEDGTGVLRLVPGG